MPTPTSTTTSPDPATSTLATTERLLSGAAEARRAQLAGLPTALDDLVVAAQRAGLEQTLRDIDAARQRLRNGNYGRCLRCADTIAAERLELRPWSEICISCADRGA